MISSSFCDACGAALPPAATACPVCGQALQIIPPRSYVAQTRPSFKQPPMQRYSVLMHRYRILAKIGEGGFGLMFMVGNILFSSSGFSVWMGYFCLALVSTIIVSGRYFYKLRPSITGKLTIKGRYELINEGLARVLPVMSAWFVVPCICSFSALYLHSSPASIAVVVGFFIAAIGIMFAILRGLPVLLNWVKRTRTAQKGQQPEQVPPMQQKMH